VLQAQRFLAGTEPLVLPVSKDMAEEEGRGQAVVDRALQAATAATAVSEATRNEEQRLFEALKDLRRVRILLVTHVRKLNQETTTPRLV
jgi:hypothetical protein